MKLIEEFNNRLDGLSTFQILLQDPVFDYLKKNFSTSQSKESGIITFIDYNKNEYQNFYYNSIFLLGYSYYEAFIYELAFRSLKIKPQLINQEFNQTTREDEIKNELNQKAWKFSKMKNLLINSLNLKYDDQHNVTLEGNLIRNCLMHNNSKVSEKLNEEFPKYTLGEEVQLNNEILDNFGIFIRDFALAIYNDAVEKYDIE